MPTEPITMLEAVGARGVVEGEAGQREGEVRAREGVSLYPSRRCMRGSWLPWSTLASWPVSVCVCVCARARVYVCTCVRACVCTRVLHA